VPDTYSPGSSARRQCDFALLPSDACSLQGTGRLKYPVILQGFSLHQDRCRIMQEEEVTAACHKTHVYHIAAAAGTKLFFQMYFTERNVPSANLQSMG